MTEPLAAACCARLPADALPLLGRLRDRDDVHVVREPGRLWVFWRGPDVGLARWLLGLPRAELLGREAGAWRELGRRLPIFDVPDPQTGLPIASLLFPAPVEPTPPGGAMWAPVRVTLAPDDQPRPTTALRLPLAAMAQWAESATTHAMQGLLAARHGGAALLRGRLPALTGKRFWGKRVLVPAGYRPEPALAEAVLAEALR